MLLSYNFKDKAEMNLSTQIQFKIVCTFFRYVSTYFAYIQVSNPREAKLSLYPNFCVTVDNARGRVLLRLLQENGVKMKHLYLLYT